MSAAGLWFVTPHAVERYRERVKHARRLSYEQALAELIRASHTAKFKGTREGGAMLFRGPKPLRLRFVVQPPPEPGALPQFITILPLFSGPSGGAHAT